MKIMQINSVYKIGSTGKIAYDIHQILKGNKEVESYVVYGRGRYQNYETIKIGNDYNIYNHIIYTRILDKHGFASKTATKKFLQTAYALNPDIIHLHNIHGYFINIELLFKYLKEYNKQVVWTLHDCWPFTGHCAYFDYIQCEKWKDGCFKCPQKIRYPKSILFDNSKNNYLRKKELFTNVKNMTIVTPSKWLYNLVKESFLKEYEIKLIYHGIDLNIFKPNNNSDIRKKYGLKDEFVILGVANIWDVRKGLEYFIELSKKITNKQKIMLVGVNENQLRNLPSNIIGIKRTNDLEELVEIYNLADIFVNPTLEEVLGLVNIESLACGTPVVTFRSGGSPETIDEHTGFIVEKGDLDGLANLILNLPKDIKHKMSSSCRSRAEKYFNKDERYMDYIRLYENIIRGEH